MRFYEGIVNKKNCKNDNGKNRKNRYDSEDGTQDGNGYRRTTGPNQFVYNALCRMTIGAGLANQKGEESKYPRELFEILRKQAC